MKTLKLIAHLIALALIALVTGCAGYATAGFGPAYPYGVTGSARIIPATTHVRRVYYRVPAPAPDSRYRNSSSENHYRGYDDRYSRPSGSRGYDYPYRDDHPYYR